MKDKNKRKHHESTIGKIIYGFLLFAPLLAIAVTSGYAVFNKNAYQTSNEEFSTKFTTINSPQEITNNFDYLVKSVGNAYSQYQGFTNISLELPNDGNNYNEWQLNFNRIVVHDSTSDATVIFNNWNTELTEFTYTSNGNVGTWQTTGLNIYGIQYRKSNFLNNIYYYAINQVEESNLFNWSKNTAIYTVLNNTCSTLGITNTFWPMLMAYWLIISVIYILYDIVLMMLVIFHRKVHCLQDSI